MTENNPLVTTYGGIPWDRVTQVKYLGNGLIEYSYLPTHIYPSGTLNVKRMDDVNLVFASEDGSKIEVTFGTKDGKIALECGTVMLNRS